MQLAAIMAAGLVGAWSASASISVTLNSVNPSEAVQVNGNWLYAGVYNLTVDGLATPSFCIDVAHGFDVGATATDYNYVPLASAPNNPNGPMGAAAAHWISGLWGTYYTPGITQSDAAALQVAIWMAVSQGDQAPALSIGNASLETAAAGMLSNVQADSGITYAQLFGLVGSAGADEQGFVVPVPEPTTVIAGLLLLLPLGASTLRIVRKNRLA